MKKFLVFIIVLFVILPACEPAASNSTPASPSLSITATQAPSQTATPIPSPTLTPTLLPTSTSTPVPNPILERVAQTGGGINGITIEGDVAYVGMGSRVAAIDISQHEHPQLIKQSELLPGLVTQLLLITSGEAPLLLIGAGKYLMLVDTSNPDNLKPIYQLELEGAISALVWDAQTSRAYAGVAFYQRPTTYTGLISSVDFTPDNQLILINSVSMPEFPLSLALGKESLFAGAEGYKGGLYHIHMNSVGKLFQPHQVIASRPEEPLQPLYMQVIGEHLYLGYINIEAYDITNPDQPLKIWEVRVPGCDIVKGFSVVGDQAYAFGWTILSEFVRGGATVPQQITGSPMGEIASVTAIHNGDFLVASNDLEIYATDNPQDLKMIGTYHTPVINVRDAVVNDKAIYVFDIGDGGSTTKPVLRVLSLPDLKPLGQLTTEFPTWYNFYGITLDGDRLYLANEGGLWAYDVGNTEPALLGKVDIKDEQLEAITAINLGRKRLLFVIQSAEGKNNVMRVYDLTDLQKPTILGNPITLAQGFGIQMTWNGSAIVVLLEYAEDSNPNSGTLYVIDYVNSALELRGSLEIPGYIEHLAVSKDIILLAGTDFQRNNSFVSAVDPVSLKLLSQTNSPEEGMGIAITKDMALVVVGYHLNGGQNGAAQLLVYDFQDPAHPRQMEAMDIAVSTNYKVPILVTTSYVVLANGSGGLELMEADH